MPSIYSLKPAFQGLLRPFVSRIAQLGIRANQITVFTCLLSIALGAALCFHRGPWMLALPAFFVIRMALNAADGMLAREFGQSSKLGAYLNELGDVISDAFLYLPFAYLGTLDPLWVAVVIVLAIITEMTGILAVVTGAHRRYDGPMGKSDRALVFGALALWIGLGWPVAPGINYWFLRVLSALLVLTIANRIRN